MHTRLYEYLIKNRVRNLFTLNKDAGRDLRVCKLTKPILEPEEMITTFFPVATKNEKTDEQMLESRLMADPKKKPDYRKAKTGTFASDFNSFGNSFDIK